MYIEILKDYPKGAAVPQFRKGTIPLVDKTTGAFLIKKKFARKAKMTLDELRERETPLVSEED